MCKRGIFVPSGGRFWRCMAVGREGLEVEYVQKCMVTDVSVFHVGDGLGHVCMYCTSVTSVLGING